MPKAPRKRAAAPAADAPAPGVTYRIEHDRELGESRTRVRIDFTAPPSPEMVAALQASLREASSPVRIETLRAAALALPADLPERRTMLDAIERAAHLARVVIEERNRLAALPALRQGAIETEQLNATAAIAERWAWPDVDWPSVDSFLQQAAGLYERALRRIDKRKDMARRAEGGKTRAANLAGKTAKRHAEIRVEWKKLVAEGKGSDAASILAKRLDLSASTIRRIVAKP
jgi:hypothetical protein